MHNCLSDLRFACRALANNRIFAFLAVLILGLGIGINTTIFSGLYAYLWAPFPYADSERLVSVAQSNPAQGIERMSVSYLDIEDWRQAGSLASIAAYAFQGLALNSGSEPVNVEAVAASPNLFSVLGVQPPLGRGFGAAEQTTGEHRVAVISEGLWRRQFASDANIIGREISLDGKVYAITGVLPPEFTFLDQDIDVFVPLYAPPAALGNRANRFLRALGRLRPGVTIPQVQAEIQAISAHMERETPATNRGWLGKVVSLKETVISHDARLASYTALLAVFFVLLIACANVANLLLARGAVRGRELAIRASLGASRAALLRLLLAESMVLALAGAVLGVAMAYWCLPLLKSITPDLPRRNLFQLNTPALLYAMGLALATGILAGIAPGWLQSRGDPSLTLQSHSRATTGGRRTIRFLVTAQVAFAFALLAASGLLIRSVTAQINSSLGFEKKNLLMATVSLPNTRYPAAAQRQAFLDQTLRNLRSNARVTNAAAAETLPIYGFASGVAVSIEGRVSGDSRVRNMAGRTIITPDYFRTLAVPLVSGREFDERDGPQTPPVAIINRTMAERYWPDVTDVVGRRFRFGPDWITVVGVAADVRPRGIAVPALPAFFLPYAQAATHYIVLMARTQVDPKFVAGDMRAAVRSADRDQPVGQLASVEEMLDRRVAPYRAITRILSALSGTALLLACIGMYGVMAYTTIQRTREIGVRIAVGAQRADIFRMVLSGCAGLLLGGLAAGLVLAYIMTPLLGSLLAGIPPHDKLTLIVISGVLISSGLLACGVPAGRAMAVDPVGALRME